MPEIELTWTIEPPPCVAHVARDALREEPEAAHVHREDLVPARERVVEGRRAPDDAGVVHEHVEPRHRREHLLDEALDLVGLREVAGEGLAAPPEGAHRGRRLLAVRELPRRHEHVGARLGEAERELAADAAPAARHERRAAREVEELLHAHGPPLRTRA